MALPLVGAVAAAVGGTIKVTAALGAILVALVFIQDWLKIFPDWLVNIFASMMQALGRLLKDLLVWVFEQIMDLIIYILDAIDLDFSAFNPAQYIAGIPQDVINVIALIRLPEALAIILAAIGIKVILQLIPFTRLGG